MTIHISARPNTIWRVKLFGGPALVDRYGVETRRFRSQKIRALLGYLSLNLGIACSREVMSEILWPDEDPQVTANRFRVALSSLRRQLEPEDTAFGSVLDASEPRMVRLRGETVSCDYVDFCLLWRLGRHDEAMRIVDGPLLPDIYEDWALDTRAEFEGLIDTDTNRIARFQAAARGGQESLIIDKSLKSEAPLPGSVFPLFLTRFFGRRAEMDCIRRLLREERLITVSGIGGVGKTRIVCEIPNSDQGKCLFVSLSDVHTACELDAAIRRAAGDSLPGDDPQQNIESVLINCGCRLLILDGAENIVEPVAEKTMRLLAANNQLRILVTSRQALGVAGEAVVALRPLEAPKVTSDVEIDPAEYASISLFVDRARNARPDFALNARNQVAVAEICSRLDGIPLALELAAARVSLQTPGQIAYALRHDLAGLSSSHRGLSERHRSFKSVVQTSIAALPAEIREFLFRLVTLPNGWTLKTARTMAGGDRADEFLERLVRSSLVELREHARTGAIQYSFLETVRQFTLQYMDGSRSAQIWGDPGNLVINGSFECDIADESWFQSEGGLYAYPFIVPKGWIGDGSCNVNAPNYIAFYSGPPHGANTAVVGDHTKPGRLYQDLNARLKVGDVIVVSALVGNRALYEGTGRVVIETVSGRMLSDTGEVAAEPGAFRRVRQSCKIDQDFSALGEQIRVVLERPSGVQANFDCICVTVNSDQGHRIEA